MRESEELPCCHLPSTQEEHHSLARRLELAMYVDG